MPGLASSFTRSSPNSGGLGQVRDTADLGTGTTRPSLGDIAVGIGAGGIRGRIGVDDVTVQTSAERQALIKRLSRSFGTTAGEVEDLRGLVRPGFSEFRRAGLAELENRRSRSIGNLRDNLARRRVSGSSFATDALARAEAEFAQEAATFSAQSTLQEIDSFFQLTSAVGELRAQEVQTFISELNLQADVALALQGKAADALSAASQIQQRNAAETVGFAAGAGTAICVVAREVYGEFNMDWRKFRAWLFTCAPNWFFDFYVAHGERVAGVIKRAPVLKRILRPLMDRAWR